MKSLRMIALVAAVFVSAGAVSQAVAAAMDTPAINLVEVRRAELVVEVQAGASGAPAGFVIEWMTKAQYDAHGWPAIEYADPVIWCTFDGTPTLTTWGDSPSYLLGPNERALVQVGDLFDETGMWVYGPMDEATELKPGVSYVFRVHAEGLDDVDESAYSETYVLTTEANPNDCTFTQGYWKTHGPAGCVQGNNTNAWPVTSLTLGSVVYTDLELCAILQQPAQGNGLISLAHQLIACKLNLANGANPLPVAADVAAADALIGGLIIPPTPPATGFIHPSQTSSLTDDLDDYNNGLSGVPHCGATAARNVTWGTVKASYR